MHFLFDKFCIVFFEMSRGGEIGRRTALRGQREKSHRGSSPLLGTIRPRFFRAMAGCHVETLVKTGSLFLDLKSFRSFVLLNSESS